MFKSELWGKWKELKSWRPFFIIFIVGFILYAKTLWFGLTYLDDNVLVLQNAPILEHWRNLGLIFSNDVFLSSTKFYYRPLLNLYFMIGAHLAGALPFIYHLGNILLHIAASSLIFVLLDKVLKKKTLAFFLALIFLVHPVLTQAVAWIPGSNDSLLALFSSAAFLALLSFSKKSGWPSLIWYNIFLLLALFTKETAIALPFIAVVYFFTIGRKDKSELSDRLILLACSLIPLAVWWLLRTLVIGQTIIHPSAIWGSLASNFGFGFIIASKLILPVKLSVLATKADSPFIYAIIIWPLIIAALAFSRHKRWDNIIFGSAWFFLFLLPTFAVFNQAPYFLEHRLYLPFIGLLIVLAEIDWIKKLDFSRRSVLAGSLVLLIILSGLSVKHSLDFSNRLTFWQSAVASAPHSPLAQKNLAVMYYFKGDYALAEKHDDIALSLNPQETMVHNNLGVIYMDQGKYALAKKEFNKELEINPGYDKAEANLEALNYQENKLR